MDTVKLREDLIARNTEIFLNIKSEEINALTDAILEAKRVYVAGWGRAGNVIKVLSMDCSQTGLKTHIVGDNSTPSIHEGDILIIGSGKGETDTMKILADQCKEHGAKLALVTRVPDSYIGRMADYVVNIPVTPVDREKDPIALQLSFYQINLWLNDIIMSKIADKKGLHFKEIREYHNNLE